MKNIGIIGAGTMGVGIAQVAATAGCKVVLFDANAPQIDKALTGLEKTLQKLPKKVKFLRKKPQKSEITS
jgi:3-hydroxybutyryl-CoA dehydrogenase